MRRGILADCLKRNRGMFLIFALMSAINLTVFWLYRIEVEPFFYAELLIFVFMALFLIADIMETTKKAEQLAMTKASVLFDCHVLPEAETAAETSYQEMIVSLGKELEAVKNTFREEHRDMQDYYTVWVHQIKTPIAVMKLKFTGKDSELSSELFRIEQYVDMALTYMRLGSDSNDLVIREYPLDELIRDTVRKFAPLFILRKLKLDYQPTDQCVVTDKKWFLCILEQLISNAIKYTPEGTVSVSASANRLTVADTGIGIAPEDLPRIFEKGYTGLNGRQNAKSSGLGLYLCKKACDLLNLQIRVESVPGKGSRFTVLFPTE